MRKIVATWKHRVHSLVSFWLVLFVVAWAALGGLMPWGQRAAASVPQDTGTAASGPMASSNGAGTVRILPNPAYVDVGGTVTVYVWLENAENYYGLDFRFTFEKARVSIPANKASLLWEVFDEENHLVVK
ncbi:MAG: hypothetical protein H5T71_10170, partial [Chloroflexi bacterium]|nr:hypothetical protein [Chloroflexota bacterium]